MRRTFLLAAVALLATGLIAWRLRPRPDAAAEPEFVRRHREAIALLDAGVADPALFRAALAALPPEPEDVDRDLYLRGIAWLEAGRRDLAEAALREAPRRALGEPDG